MIVLLTGQWRIPAIFIQIMDRVAIGAGAQLLTKKIVGGFLYINGTDVLIDFVARTSGAELPVEAIGPDATQAGTEIPGQFLVVVG